MTPMTEKREKQILMISFLSGLAFAVVEFIFAIYSRSQSALTDAVYDLSELVFIALLIFLTPLFHKPVSEKHPYGYFQVESVFVIIKGVMMLSVTTGVAAGVIESLLSGGSQVDHSLVAGFQCILGVASLVIFLVMKRLSRSLASPTIDAELLGWRLDIAYSLGMALAFSASRYLERTPLSPLVPYFDQIIAVLVMVFMLPESIKVLWSAIRELFLFSPEQSHMAQIKAQCAPILAQYHFTPVFYDVTKTGRHLWVAVYFHVQGDSLPVQDLKAALHQANTALKEVFTDCTCELILLA